MYSDIANSLGLTQGALETMVLSIVGIFIFGAIVVLYWKYIVVGALVLGCVAVMANHQPNPPKIMPTIEQPPSTPKISSPVKEEKEEIINEVKPVEKEETKTSYNMFMEDCLNLADYPKSRCEELWREKVDEERTLIEENKTKGIKG